MALRWDPLLVRALAGELHDRLAGMRLRAIRLDGATRDLVLLFREATLAWSLHPTRGAPLLWAATEPAASDLALPSRVRLVRAPPDERILVLELLPARGRGSRDLVVELLGNQWNALVTEGPDARIRHVLVRREGRRPVRVGDAYEPPPPSDREGVDEPITATRWREILDPAPPADRRRTLVRHVAWTSTVNGDALVDAGDDPAAALERGYAAWRAMAHEGLPTRPCLLDVGGTPQPYPWPLQGYVHRETDTLLDAFRRWAEGRPAAAGAPGAEALLPPEMVSALERAADTALRRVTSLQAQLDGLEDPAALRARGDLLLARFRDVPSGVGAVELEDFAGGSVRIELDPSLPTQENAAAYYDRAARSERARRRLPDLLREARRAAVALEDLLGRARTGGATTEEVASALPAAAEPPGKLGQPPSPLPYRTYRSSGGLEIRVGRGARANDDLTFHHAAPDDVWLHARHASGAHVVLRWGRPGNPPARDLEEAAVLAALSSRARTSGTVPVDWTLRKYVRKPRGAAPGAVVPQRVKTLFVEPDPALGERLVSE